MNSRTGDDAVIWKRKH